MGRTGEGEDKGAGKLFNKLKGKATSVFGGNKRRKDGSGSATGSGGSSVATATELPRSSSAEAIDDVGASTPKATGPETADAAAGAVPESTASKLLSPVAWKEALLPLTAGPSDFDLSDPKHATLSARMHWRKMSMVRNAARRFRYTPPPTQAQDLAALSSSDRFRVGGTAVRALNRFKSVLPKLADAQLARAKAAGFNLSPKQLEELVAAGTGEALGKAPFAGVSGIAESLQSDVAQGIPGDDVDVLKRTQIYGTNAIPEKPPKPFLEFVWDAMQDSTLWILTACAFASLVVGVLTEGWHEGWYDGVGVLLSIILVVAVTAISDYRQSVQFRLLDKEKKKVSVSVMRGGQRKDVPIMDLVVGDVVYLSTGDILPADGVLIAGHSLVVDESSMTGESLPCYKGKDSPILLAGTKVQDGHGTMLVVGVGMHTEWGQLMSKLIDSVDDETPLQVKLSGVATLIGQVGLYVAVLVFFILLGRLLWAQPIWNWGFAETLKVVDYFAVAVTIVVVAVPEGLPLAVTLSLAFAMKKMMADKALVRKLAACETMGSATTICSDKTGTLTANQMTAVRLWLPSTVHNLEADGALAALPVPEDAKSLLAKHIFLNSSGDVQGEEYFGTPTETAFLALGVGLGGDFQAVTGEPGLETLQFVPFNSTRKRMGAVVKLPSGKIFILWKGAAEMVLDGCTHALDPQGKVVPLDKASAAAVIEGFSKQALRTLSVAYRELKPSELPKPDGNRPWPEDVPVPDTGLILQAIVGIKDPLRKEVKKSINVCKEAGINVRMITGDNLATAVAIAQDAGILTEGGVAIEGPKFRSLSREEMVEVLPRLQVMARSSPTDKHLMVKTLREMGDVVAVTGDGTNDAPALKEAEIGLAMGIAGTEVAKESADVIVMDDNFASVVNVARWGRSVYTNIQKFVQFQLTVNIVALTVNFVSALTSGDAPLTAVQLLWVNLIMDSLGALALATEPPDNSLMSIPPVGKRVPFISPVMWRNIFGQAIFQLVLLTFLSFEGVPLLGLEDSHPGNTELALNTILFNTFVFCQLFNEVNSRELEKINVLKGLGRNFIFLAIIAVCTIFQVVLVQYLGKFASTAPLTLAQFVACIALASIAMPVAAFVKTLPVPKTTPSQVILNAVYPPEEEKKES